MVAEHETGEGGTLAKTHRNWRRTSLMVPIKLLEDLDAAAEDQGYASRADLIRVACRHYVRNRANAPELPPTVPGHAPLTAGRKVLA